MTGFDPLGDQPSPDNPQAGDGSGGTAGSFAGQGGNGTFSGSGGASSGGFGGSGGRPSGGSGGAGGMNMLPDASVPMDGGPPRPITSCTGKSNLSSCSDNKYCTIDDFCFDEVCVSGDARTCRDECNTGTCDEVTDSCVLTPVEDGTECEFFDDEPVCIEGACSSPIIRCSEGGNCKPACIDRTCDVICVDSNSCAPTCSDGADCSINCQGSAECAVECDNAVCSVGCQGTGTCDVDCTGAATCAITCTDASGCNETDCLDGSSCTLLCLEGESCGFRNCWANEQQCGDGKVVCGNAECDE